MIRTLPTSSVVIGTRDRPHLLHATVESILAGTVVPDEIIVVDQSSHPQPLTRLQPERRSNAVRHLPVTTAGLSAARNIGLRAARHDVVAVTDDDMIASPRWLEALLEALRRGGPAVVVTGRVDAGDPEAPRAFVPSSHAFERPQRFRGRLSVDVLAGGNMALYRATLQDVGCFDERLGPGTRFPAAEDNDFGYRVLKAGLEIEYVPQAVLVHRAWRTGSAYFRLRWCYGLGKGGFYGKHLRDAQGGLLGRAASDIGRRVRRVPRNAVARPKQAVADGCYVGGVVVGLARWLATERDRGGACAD